ncbi:MAG TPA: carboxypeptidase-like regulatory domain-containing protein, partial [Nitrospiraceae bacterium]|nr:carboxypeptidase-like regulatory domain-containing protein [Nitrospiraceae bacterium]
MPECRRLILSLCFHLIGLIAICLGFIIGLANPWMVIAAPLPDGSTREARGRPVTGRVLSAADAKPLAGVRLTLAGQSATTEVNGQFRFAQPPSGYQLVKIEQVLIEPHRKRLKDGSLGGHMHADPVLVNVSS